MKKHKQIWVKVNNEVDEGIAPIIKLLNKIDGLCTIDSCEGYNGWAYIYFRLGDYRTISKFLFGELAPTLINLYEEDITLSVEVINDLKPVGKISFRKEITDRFLKTLRLQVSAYRKSM